MPHASDKVSITGEWSPFGRREVLLYYDENAGIYANRIVLRQLVYSSYVTGLFAGNGWLVISDSRLHAIPYLQVGFILRSVYSNCNILAVDTTQKSCDTCLGNQKG